MPRLCRNELSVFFLHSGRIVDQSPHDQEPYEGVQGYLNDLGGRLTEQMHLLYIVSAVFLLVRCLLGGTRQRRKHKLFCQVSDCQYAINWFSTRGLSTPIVEPLEGIREHPKLLRTLVENVSRRFRTQRRAFSRGKAVVSLCETQAN